MLDHWSSHGLLLIQLLWSGADIVEDLFYTEVYEKHGSCNHNQLSMPAYFATALELHRRYPFLVGRPCALPHTLAPPFCAIILAQACVLKQHATSLTGFFSCMKERQSYMAGYRECVSNPGRPCRAGVAGGRQHRAE